MKYHLYFHNDLDGVSSASVLLNFFRARGNDAASFNPIDYKPGLKENWPERKFKQPSVMVDFLYHPDLTWWFDHHPTSFINESWRMDYKNDATHYFDPKHRSCASATLYHLKKEYDYQPPEFIEELVVGADLIDGAGYKSPEEAIDFNNPTIRLGLLLREHKTSDPESLLEFYSGLADNLSVEPMETVLARPEYKEQAALVKSKLKLALENFDKFTETRGDTIFVDVTKTDSAISHFTVYYMRPEAKYSVRLGFDPETEIYYLGVGRNKWKDSPVNIGELMSKYGGGGHKNVGGTESKSKKEIMKIVQEVIKYLNKHG